MCGLAALGPMFVHKPFAVCSPQLLGAQVAPPPQARDHDRALEHQFVALLVTKRKSPTAQLVKALDGVDAVPVEGIAPHLAVADDVQPDLLLQGHRVVHGAVLKALKLCVAESP